MTAPVFLAPTDALASGSSVVLDGAEGHHAVRVRRIQVGGAVVLADGLGLWVEGLVSAVDGDRLVVRVVARHHDPAPELHLTVVQALAKGERGERAVELMTEVGVDTVVPWRAAHCVVRWEGERGERAQHRWQRTAAEAGKQARRTRGVVVTPAMSTAEVVSAIEAATVGLVLDETARRSITEVELPTAGEVLVVVGPEGGLSDDERSQLAAAGARAVRLGPTVLRTSTAGAVAAAVLLAATPRWRPTA